MHFCILSHFCITKCTRCLIKRAEALFVKLGSKDLFLSSTRPCHLEACTLSLNSWVSYFFIKLKTKWSPRGKGQILFGGFFFKNQWRNETCKNKIELWEPIWIDRNKVFFLLHCKRIDIHWSCSSTFWQYNKNWISFATKHLFTYLQEIQVPLTYFPICVKPIVSKYFVLIFFRLKSVLFLPYLLSTDLHCPVQRKLSRDFSSLNIFGGNKTFSWGNMNPIWTQ